MWFTNRIAALILRWFSVLSSVLACGALFRTLGSSFQGIPHDPVQLALVAIVLHISLVSFLAAGWMLERGGRPRKQEVLVGWVTLGGALCGYLLFHRFHPLLAVVCFLGLGAAVFFSLAVSHPDGASS